MTNRVGRRPGGYSPRGVPPPCPRTVDPSLPTPTLSFEPPAHTCLDELGRPLDPESLRARLVDRVAIVIPAYEEGETLPELLPRIPDRLGDTPIVVLVVDDGSRDDTAAAAMRAGALVAQLPVNRGGGAALRAGYHAAVTAGASIVVTLDADGQHRPEEIAQVVEPVLSGRVDFAAGSRVLGSAEPGAFARELGIAFFNRVVRALTRTHVTDCSNGFRAIRTEVLATLDLREPQFHAAEFLVEALTRGVRFEEVPISVLRRAHGHSKKPPTLRYGWGFCAAIVHAWRRSVARRSLAHLPLSARRDASGSPAGDEGLAGAARTAAGADRRPTAAPEAGPEPVVAHDARV